MSKRLSTEASHSVDWNALDKGSRHRLAAALAHGEVAQALLPLDLDREHKFARGALLLSDRRILLCEGNQVQSWPRTQIAALRVNDRGGLGVLQVDGHDARLASLPFTLAFSRAATDLVAVWECRHRDEEDEAPEAIAPEPPVRLGTLFRLLIFAKPHAWHLSFGVLLTLATTAAGLVAPYLAWPLVDDILSPYQNRVRELKERLSGSALEAAIKHLQHDSLHDFSRVQYYLLGMLGAAVFAWALGWAQGYVLSRLSERISADLRNTSYRHLHRMSMDYFAAKRTGDLVSRISSDTDRICNFLADTLTDFVTDVLMIIGTGVVMFTMDPILALATIATFPITAWLTLHLRNRLTHGFLHGSRAWGQMTAILADTIPGIRVVKAFAQEHREVERFADANTRIVDANNRVNGLWTFFWPMVGLLNQFGLLLVWALGTWQVYNNRITVGVLTAFLAYIARFYTRLESMTRMSNNTQRAAASAQRIFDVLDRSPSVPEPARPLPTPQVRGEITLSHLSFRYGSRKVIDDITLRIAPGEMVGLVGPTGAGKSTLVNLVCRFYDPSEGAVLLDGKDIRSFAVADYRQNIGIVLQEPFLFYGTIADNIAYGKPNASREEIIAAAKAARAHEFILQLAEGYDSLIGERGQTLSGGERQRISIARALLIDPKILILDEATSAIDPHTERQIQEALDNLVRDRTTIAIAHRLSTLRAASRIVVLDRGHVVEVGSHDELLAMDGVYRRIYDAQARKHEEAA